MKTLCVQHAFDICIGMPISAYFNTHEFEIEFSIPCRDFYHQICLMLKSKAHKTYQLLI